MILKGSKFQIKVWKYLKTIPKGKVKTYKQVAIGINMPKSARAVANACGKNPRPIIVPLMLILDGVLDDKLATPPDKENTKSEVCRVDVALDDPPKASAEKVTETVELLRAI